MFQVVRENENVTLGCDATGYPKPHIVWRREDGEDIVIGGKKVEKLNIFWGKGAKISGILFLLTLCRAAPLAVSKVRGGHICPPQVSEGAGGLWFQIFVATLYLTQIDTRKKDLPFSDA